MTTAISGGVTIIESESGNQDWVGGGGDPDTIDLDNFTFGTDYIDFKTLGSQEGWRNDVKKRIFPGGIIVATPLRERDTFYPFNGYNKGIANKNKIKKFAENHAELGDNECYLIVKEYDGYVTFYNSAGSELEYAEGWIERLTWPRNGEDITTYYIQGIFQITF